MNRFNSRAAIAPALAVLALLGVGGGGAVGVPVTVDAAAGEGISPSNPLYAVERLGENIRLGVTPPGLEQARMRMALAEERIGEAEVEAALGNAENVEALVNEYGSTISELAQELREARFESPEAFKEQLKLLVEKATSVGATTLQGLLESDRIPDVAKSSIGQALERAKVGQQRALEALDGLPTTTQAGGEDVAEREEASERGQQGEDARERGQQDDQSEGVTEQEEANEREQSDQRREQSSDQSEDASQAERGEQGEGRGRP